MPGAGLPSLRRAPGPLAWSAGFAVLTAVVVGGAADPFDRRVQEWVRPGGAWGTLQIEADRVVEGLRPTVTVAVVLLVALFVALRRRSPWPLVVPGLVLTAATVAVLLVQGLVGRPDAHGAVDGFDGSYPSGHTVVVTVGAALVVRLLAPGWRRRQIAVAGAAGGLMGAALVVQVAHWTTDVVGALLLAGAVLSSAEAARRSLSDTAVPRTNQSSHPS